MDLLIYAFFLLGSFSTGYLLLRTGFPSTQSISLVKKLALSYIIGAIVFGGAILITTVAAFASEYFILAAFILLAMIFVVMLAKRIIFEEKDPVLPKTKKKKADYYQPEQVLAKRDEKKIAFEHGLMIKTKQPLAEKKQVFKEKSGNIPAKAAVLATTVEEKNKALEMLRNVAQQIKQNKADKKKEKEESEDADDVEEDLLKNLEGLNDKTEEEEY